MKRAKVHLDSTEASGPLHRALCGYWNVAVTSDVTAASCKICLALLRGEPRNARPRALSGAHTAQDLAAELHIALAAAPALGPSAGPPPRLTAPLWDSSCRGAEHRRCGSCVLCEWEREAERYHFASPWTKKLEVTRSDDAPRWGSLNAALIAMLEHELSGRVRGSALGSQLARLERGDAGADRDPRKMVGREIRAASDVVHVQAALQRAYAQGHGPLSAWDCAVVLLERTPGALAGVTGYETLSERYRVGEDLLKAVVRHGRAVMTEDLASRGLIPARSMRPRGGVTESTTWRPADATC